MSTPYLEDGALLARFVEQGDQSSFEELLQRHGGLVFGVCCRVLGQTQDAEDATQAVFLTLASKAHALKRCKSVAGWLHQVAQHIALRAKSAAQSRRKREREAGMAGVTVAQSAEPDSVWDSIKPHLDAELAELPEKYRVPIILHHVEGRTQEEVATLLGCSYGTLSGRLSRARELLRSRLVRRGVAVALPMLFLAIGQKASVAMPAALAASTGRAAPFMLAAHTSTPELFSAQAKALSEGALRAMFMSKVKTAAAVVAIILFSASAAAYASRTTVSTPQLAQPAARAAEKPADVKDDKTPTVAGAPAANVDPQIAHWILQLGSDDADTHLAAMEGLRKAGDAALPALESAAAKAKSDAKSRLEILCGARKTSKTVEAILAQEKLIKSIDADLETSALMGGENITSTGHLKALPQAKQMIETHLSKFGPMEMSGRTISDGKTVWTESQLPALGTEKRVMITRHSLDGEMGSQKQEWQFEKYAAEFDFVKAREEQVNGVDAYILDGIAREDFTRKQLQELEEVGAPALVASIYTAMRSCTLTVGRDGFLRRIEIRDDKNVVVQKTAYTNVKLDTVLDAAQFIYCPPPSAKVTDLDEYGKTAKKKSPEPASVKPPEAPKNF